MEIYISDISDRHKRVAIVNRIVAEAGGAPLTFTVPLDNGSGMAFNPSVVEYDGIFAGWLHDGTIVSQTTVEEPGYPWEKDAQALVLVTDYRVTGRHYSTSETHTKHHDVPLPVAIPTESLRRVAPATKAVEG